MSETSDLIFAWLKEEFPQAGWDGQLTTNLSPKTNITEIIRGAIGGITLELHITQKELLVSIWTKTPRNRASKVREVHLTDPTSIDSLQEVVRHTIKITTNPFLGPPNAGLRQP